jgi:plastocyanin
MHTAALHLTPILGAEKSRVPFYIAGGLLVAWALIVSLGVGLRRPDFPGNLAGQRAVMAISAVLVLAAVATAVITSGTPAKAGAASAATTSTGTTSAPVPSATTPGATTTSAPTPGATTTSPTTPAAPVRPLKLAANPSGLLSYDTKQLSAKAGTITITFTNAAPLEHNLTIAQGSKVLGATPTFVGGNRTLTLSLKAGSYTFYCSVPGHRQAGMEGTLSVS